ncbi:hypothetical protein HHI36_023159, partial [Cryptolaemus montrouzieri]
EAGVQQPGLRKLSCNLPQQLFEKRFLTKETHRPGLIQDYTSAKEGPQCATKLGEPNLVENTEHIILECNALREQVLNLQKENESLKTPIEDSVDELHIEKARGRKLEDEFMDAETILAEKLTAAKLRKGLHEHKQKRFAVKTDSTDEENSTIAGNVGKQTIISMERQSSLTLNRDDTIPKIVIS